MESLSKNFAAAVMVVASTVAEPTTKKTHPKYSTGMCPSFVMDTFKYIDRLFSADDRKDLSDRSDTDFSAIGQLRIDINNDGKADGICTAVLINDKEIKTAAHCLYSPITQEKIPLKYISFHAGYRNGQSVAVSSVEEARIGKDFEYGTYASRWDVSDTAYLKLSESFNGRVNPIPLASAEEVRVATNNTWISNVKELDVLQAGYSGDIQEIITGSECTLKRTIYITNGAFKSNCDIAQGDSGSPVLLKTPNGLKIAGILTNATPEKGELYVEESYGHAGFLNPTQEFKPF